MAVIPQSKPQTSVKPSTPVSEVATAAPVVQSVTPEPVVQEVAAVALGNLVMKYWYDTPVLLYGHNTQFDLNFTKQLMMPFDIMFNTAITVVDLSTLGVVLFDIHTSNNIFDLCFTTTTIS
jgi:hypothetical protein